MLIVGGMGTLVGPVIGAVFLVILPEASRFLVQFRELVYGVILIAVILFRPKELPGCPGSFILPPERRGWKRLRRGGGEMSGILEARSVSVNFGGLAALKQVEFSLAEGQIVGLIGPTVRGRPPCSTA